MFFLLIVLVCSTLAGCPATTMSPSDAGRIEGLYTQSPGGADDYIIVDCRLPGQIRQLGQRMIYLSRGNSEKTTARDCAVRGGEFAMPGQSDYTRALMVWLPDAEAGNKEAQFYVGQIYQRGLGVGPQYDLAAVWYKKSAKQGYAKSQMNLAYLYEKGLGVEKNPQQALLWYRRAGLGDSITLDENTLSFQERQELQQLREEVNRRNDETRMLRQKLEQIQKDLEDTSRQLNQRRSDTEDQNQRQDVAALTSEIVRYEETIKNLRAQLVQKEEILKKLPAPRIEIYDPLAQRGVSYEMGKQDLKKRLVAGMVWAPAGLASFKVNQKTEKVAPDGKFRVQVPLNQSGDTTATFIAVDKRGQRTRITHNISRSIAGQPEEPPIPGIDPNIFGRYHALIIGNNTYRKLSRLKTAVNDATEIDKILKNRYGFSTRLLVDATRDDIILALHSYTKSLTKNDNLLIYYAGHGYLDVKNNRGYWQPVDADRDNSSNWIANYAVTDQLNAMKAKEVLIISDSCYSGSFTRGVAVAPDTPQTADARLKYLKVLAKGRARKVLTSGELAPVLDAGRGGHSVFANVLLEVLKANDQVIEGSLLHQEMSARVVNDSDRFGLTQVPLYASNNDAGHESGDFIFVPKK
jgi:hypothetical protein